tara:strand:- start:323 stop:625 length:303 start_codon:yes stop_codon:yes gene_type:complete
MKAAARIGDNVYTGHLCSIIVPLLVPSQSGVFINGVLAATVFAELEPHSILSSGSCVPHTGTVISGSTKVTFGGLAAARIGDPADLGNIITGSPNVFIGG